MMNYIWAGIILLSIVCGFSTGKIPALSNSVLEGAGDAVNLIISITGMMAFWTGIMKIAEKAGITKYLSKLFTPIIKFLFPASAQNEKAVHAICMNITANLLGLGNAATPFGIKAVKELQRKNPLKNTASNDMAMFVVINTASLQLVPTFLCTLRQKYGCSNPLDIVPHLWIISTCALLAGVTCAKFFEKVIKN